MLATIFPSQAVVLRQAKGPSSRTNLSLRTSGSIAGGVASRAPAHHRVAPMMPAVLAKGTLQSRARLVIVVGATITDGLPEAAALTRFVVNHWAVPFGQHLRVVGSQPSLGEWQPAGGVVLEWSDGDVWTGTAPVPPGPFNFKIVAMYDDTLIEWEMGEDRAVEVPAFANRATVAVSDGMTNCALEGKNSSASDAMAHNMAANGSNQNGANNSSLQDAKQTLIRASIPGLVLAGQGV